MNLVLTRKAFGLYGIQGELHDEGGNPICYTLEHAYLSGNAWVPKVAVGRYVCIRHAPNRLPYETFELENVPPFQGSPVDGILIHVGNYGHDSKGCILVGFELGVGCILESQKAFEKFMELQNGVGSFTLTIK